MAEFFIPLYFFDLTPSSKLSLGLKISLFRLSFMMW
jgi:hypothetical protein